MTFAIICIALVVAIVLLRGSIAHDIQTAEASIHDRLKRIEGMITIPRAQAEIAAVATQTPDHSAEKA